MKYLFKILRALNGSQPTRFEANRAFEKLMERKNISEKAFDILEMYVYFHYPIETIAEELKLRVEDVNKVIKEECDR